MGQINQTTCTSQLNGTWDSVSNKCSLPSGELNPTTCTSQLNGTWDPVSKKCSLPSGQLNKTTCDDLGGIWDDSKKTCNLASAKCEMEKQMFFQLKKPDLVSPFICGKKYKIIFKKQLFTQDTLGQVTIPAPYGTTFYGTSDIPYYSNIIPNSLVLHLLGAGGGGGCGGNNVRGNDPTWGHGGYSGDKKVIPLESVNAGEGDAMIVSVGRGGIGGGEGGSCEKEPIKHQTGKGGTTRVVIYNTTIKSVQSTLIAKGGDGGINQIDSSFKDFNSLTLDYGCTGEPSGFLASPEFNFVGGVCNKSNKKTPGGLGEVGSGGGGGYDNYGGKGGDGAAALTWLEWIEVP